MNSDVNVSLPCSSSHQVLYKNNGYSTDTLHQKHREATIELRKKQRDDGFTRTRRLMELEREQKSAEVSVRSIFDPTLINDLTSGDTKLELAALKNYSQLLSTSHECVDYVHDMKLTQVIIDIFMKAEPITELESICIIVLSKLSSDFGQISQFLSTGLIAKVTNSLGSSDIENLTHAIFLLEEIVRIDLNTRTICKQLNLVQTSIDVYFRFDQIDLRRQIATMLNNYYEFEISIEEIDSSTLNFFNFILLNEADEILLTDTLEIISKIARNSNLHANLFIENGFLPAAALLLGSDVTQTCLSFIDSIAIHGKDYIRVLSDLGFFEQIWSIANSKEQPLKRRGEAYSVIATFVKNNYLHIKPECASQLISGLIESVAESKFEVRRQSLSVIKQLLLNYNEDAIFRQCACESLLSSLCDLLTVMHVDTVMNSIICLDKIMDFAVLNDIDSELLQILETCGCCEKFEFLTNSGCYDVFKAADSFINKYLDIDEE